MPLDSGASNTLQGKRGDGEEDGERRDGALQLANWRNICHAAPPTPYPSLPSHRRRRRRESEAANRDGEVYMEHSSLPRVEAGTSPLVPPRAGPENRPRQGALTPARIDLCTAPLPERKRDVLSSSPRKRSQSAEPAGRWLLIGGRERLGGCHAPRATRLHPYLRSAPWQRGLGLRTRLFAINHVRPTV